MAQSRNTLSAESSMSVSGNCDSEACETEEREPQKWELVCLPVKSEAIETRLLDRISAALVITGLIL